ncbi:MAG: ABC transporter substrate-binding protein [Deltaproteobacteria bacterium]|nr:ABC transporter substrate-binding protein [Deltaproteobacteria bacterium]
MLTNFRDSILGFRSVIFLLALVFSSYETPVARAQDAGYTGRLIEGARQEGELDVWSTGDVRAQNEVIERFRKKYPFISKIRAIRPQSSAMRNRLLSEARAGKGSDVDVVGGNADIMDYLGDKGFLTRYKSPEMGALVQGLKDPQDRWSAFYVNPFVTAYNRNLVAPKDIPKKWDDFLNPQWKGKIAFYREEYAWFSNFLAWAGREKGLEYMRRLAGQNVQLREGHSLMSQLLAAGEYPIIFVTYGPRIATMKAEGAPVDWVALDPVFAQGIAMGIYTKAKHPNAARLYVDYMLSREVQQEIWVNGFWKHSARTDVVPNDARWKGRRILPLDLKFTDQLNVVAQEFRGIFEPESRKK